MVSKKNMFIHTWGRFPFWLIFFNGVETTNQMAILGMSLWFSTSQYSYTPKNVDKSLLKLVDWKTTLYVFGPFFSCFHACLQICHICTGCKWIWLPWWWQVGKTTLVSTLRIHFKRPFFPGGFASPPSSLARWTRQRAWKTASSIEPCCFGIITWVAAHLHTRDAKTPPGFLHV